LMHGFAPTVAKIFSYDNIERPLSKPKESYRSIDINICHSLKEAIFHANNDNPRLKSLQSRVTKSSPYLLELAKKKKIVDLLNKLHAMSGLTGLDPKVSNIKRILKVSVVEEQLEIERALNMPMISNTDGIVLTEEEEKWCVNISDNVKCTKFCGNTADEQRAIGRIGIGILPTMIVKSFDDRIKGIDKKKFVYYSGHDNTIMPLLSHLGFNSFEIPRFAATVVFELHKIQEEWFVILKYSSDPVGENYKEMSHYRTYVIPFGGDVVPMEEAEVGFMKYDTFRKEIVEVRNSFKTYEEWYQEANDVVLPKETK